MITPDLGDNKHLNQQQFGRHAQNFVSSAVHARGYSLGRLVELVQPQPHWRVLDVATGGGHTAWAMASQVERVIASDLTYPMLVAARQSSMSRGGEKIAICQAEAAHLPFPDHSFDCVTCRIAPHHFSDVDAFVREATRVLIPGGILAIADNITSGEAASARAANVLDQFRDPSHCWAYSSDDWRVFFLSTGLRIIHSETFRKDTDLDDWATRIGVGGDDLTRLRVLLLQGPIGVSEWFSPRQVGQRVLFEITEMILIGVKD